MKKQTLTMIIGLGLMTGCAGSDEQPGERPRDERAQKQQSIQSAEATSKLLTVSNAVVGASTAGRGSNLDFELELEIEAGIDAFLDGLEDAACADVEIDVQSDAAVLVSFDFRGCAMTSGITGIDGQMTVSIEADDLGIDYDYEGELTIDGVSVEGGWSVDVSAEGSAVIDGDVSVTFSDGSGGSILIDASWKDLDGDCPVLDTHIEVADGDDLVSVDLSGYDMCGSGLCSGAVNIEVADADGSESVTIDSDGISVGDLDVGLSCGEDGELDLDGLDELPDGEEDLDGLDELPEEPDLPSF